MDPLWIVVLYICIAGAVALLIQKAPFIAADYKPYALWFVLLIVVVMCIRALWPFLESLPRPR